ncbi:MAG: hypothetical protein AAF367_14780 [Pseudomonadota bacterium]
MNLIAARSMMPVNDQLNGPARLGYLPRPRLSLFRWVSRRWR